MTRTWTNQNLELTTLVAPVPVPPQQNSREKQEAQADKGRTER